MNDWLSPQSLIGLTLTFAFLALAWRRPSRAVWVYLVLGATPPAIQIGAFAGRTISMGLLLAEVLATVLIALWLVNRRTGRLLKTPFDLPLVCFAGVVVASLVAAQLVPDPRVADRVTLAVSLGQVLLVLWPIGVYFASAEMITTTDLLRRIERTIVVLAFGQALVPFVPVAYEPYFAWVWTFALFASPFALAMAFETRSILLRLVYLVVILAPLVRGVVTGKAFLYAFVVVSATTILWLRASRLAVAAAGVVTITLLLSLALVGDDAFSPFQDLVEKERAQASYGGRAGRVQLAIDALSVWQEAPVLGVGPGNSYVYMLQRSVIGTPHNQYLNILTEFGLVGLLVWCWFLVAVFRTALHVYRTTLDRARRTFLLGSLGAFAGMVVGSITGDFMIHSIRNSGLELFQGFYLQWILLGGIVSAAALERQARTRPAAVAPPAGRWAQRRIVRPPRWAAARGRVPSST